jgi:cell division protein FtsB
VALLVVLGIVVVVGVQGFLSFMATRAADEQQQAIVRSLKSQNVALIQQQRSLSQPQTIIEDARSLGMVRPGEQPFVVSGLP